MRLVIRTRYGSAAGGLRRYNGSGIFSSIGRKLFSSGLKKVINVATKANLPQKIANVVVNGAQSAGQKFGKTVGQKHDFCNVWKERQFCTNLWKSYRKTM